MRRKFLFLFLIFGVSLFGCKKKAGKGGEMLRIALHADPTSLDPRRAGDPSTCLVVNMLYEGITRYGPDGKIEMACAMSIERSKNRLTYHITLKDDIYWSNYKKVTAYDFEYAWKKTLDPNFPAPAANLMYVIKNAKAVKAGALPKSELGVRAVGGRELIVDLEYPIPYFLELLAFPTFFPICEQEELQNPDWMNRLKNGLPTNGPFQMDVWNYSSELKVKQNPYYWDIERVGLKGIDIAIVENAQTALQLFEKGKIDWINTGIMHESPDVVASYRDSDKLIEPCLAGTFYIAFNTDVPPFDNRNFRMAFALAADRRAIAENINCDPARTFIPPILRKTPPSPLIPYSSPDEARAYLLHGMEDLEMQNQTMPKLTLYYFEGETQKRVVTALQNQWWEVLGVDVAIKQLDLKHLLNILYTKKGFQFTYIASIAQYPNPLNFLERFIHKDDPKNYMNWSNDNYRSWVDKAMSAISDSHREDYFDRAEQALFEDMPIIPLFHYKGTYFSHPYLSKVHVSPIGLSYFNTASIDKTAKQKYWKD